MDVTKEELLKAAETLKKYCMERCHYCDVDCVLYSACEKLYLSDNIAECMNNIIDSVRFGV